MNDNGNSVGRRPTPRYFVIVDRTGEKVFALHDLASARSAMQELRDRHKIGAHIEYNTVAQETLCAKQPVGKANRRKK